MNNVPVLNDTVLDTGVFKKLILILGESMELSSLCVVHRCILNIDIMVTHTQYTPPCTEQPSPGVSEVGVESQLRPVIQTLSCQLTNAPKSCT